MDECPEVFEVDYEGEGYAKVKVKNRDPGEELRSKVQDAVDYCPNRVITLIEI
jgi:ferredoxin